MTTECKIEIWPIEQLIPYAKNAKIHDDAQVTTLAGLIEKHGWTQPIVVDRNGVIIAGHGRRLAAIKLGRLKVPVVVRRDLSPAQANALRLADNRVASTIYDTTLLQTELMELSEAGEIDMNSLGFDTKELDFMTAELGDIDMESFVGDVGEAVETQKAENAKKTAEIDEIASPLTDAFGFKKVTISQSRRIKSFMQECERDTGKRGVDALMSFFDGIEIQP
jgi:ParB-like chromosome segregation protein Spo0J